jgi:hypothetical protein
MFGNRHDEQHLLKGVSIYLQKKIGKKGGSFHNSMQKDAHKI